MHRDESGIERDDDRVDHGRRRLLGAVGGGALASLFGLRMSIAEPVSPLRWGIVGTGGIANAMAPHIRAAEGGALAAVSSRRMETAQEFADDHGAGEAFDDWHAMLASDRVDAVYVATPTGVREEICVAAAENGKHVLGEKPFASLPSLQRITAACREYGVGFMDGTHFTHHPRTIEIRDEMDERIGRPWSLASAFQFDLEDRGNIRYNPRLEPMGAIGDLGWYNMRAVVEYLSPDAAIADVCAYLRRDEDSGAAVSGSGIVRFDDGATTTWVCGFDSGSAVMDLRLSGANGVINLDDFVGTADEPAVYRFRKGGFGDDKTDTEIAVASDAPAPQLMFENFAVMVNDAGHRERSIARSERTQALLDAVWEAALATERGA